MSCNQLLDLPNFLNTVEEILITFEHFLSNVIYDGAPRNTK
jgi:hypothetical protein